MRTGSSTKASDTWRSRRAARSRLAAVGIDDVAGVVLGHGVDGEIAPPQVVLERHVGRELGGEAAIARRHLALQARQRVFFLGLRMQEHREIAAHGNEPGALELGRRRADHHPVALGHLAPEQPVPNRAAHQVHLHGAHVNRRSYLLSCSPPASRSPAAARLTWPRRPRASCRSSPRASPSRGCWPIPTPTPDAQAAPGDGARGARVRLRASSGCLTTRATPRTPTSSANSWCGAWWRRRSFRWSRASGVSPSSAAWPIAATSSKDERRGVRRDAACRGLRHDRRRRAGVFHARQVQRPDPQHHDDLRRRRARVHHVPRALAPGGLHPRRHLVQRGLRRHRGTGRPGALAEVPRPRSGPRQVPEAARAPGGGRARSWRGFAAN